MATSEFTAHYHLDKYAATDKPNLRDQYNAAMDKVDDALYTANTNATDAKTTAQQASQAVSGKASQADLDALSQTVAGKASQADLTTLSALLPANQFSAQNTVKAALDAKASQTNVTNLTTRVTALESKKKMVVIGDSFSDFNDGSAVATMWPTLVANALGLELHNYAKGGSGFCVGGANIFSQQVALAVSQISDKNSVAKVFVFGGINDAHNITVTGGNIQQAANSVIVSLCDNFPKAEIIVAGVCPTRNADRAGNDAAPFDVGSANRHRYDMLTEFLALACSGVASATRKTAVKFINFRNFTYFFDGFFQSSSNWHPSLAGHMGIASKMLGGNVPHDTANFTNGLVMTARPSYINKDGTVYTATGYEVAITGPNTAQIALSFPSGTVGTGSTQPILLLNGYPSGGAFMNLYMTASHQVLTCAGDGPGYCRQQYRLPSDWNGDGFRVIYDVSI